MNNKLIKMLFTTIIIGIVLIVQVSSTQNNQENHGNDDKMVIDYKTLNDDKIKKPYQFGYEIEDGQGNLQHRHEESDGDGAKVGSYGYVDANGIYRKVEYIADKNGFRVKMSSNEPGIQGYNTPSISMITKPYTDKVTTPVSIRSHDIIGEDESDPTIESAKIKTPKSSKEHQKHDHHNRHREHFPEHRLNNNRHHDEEEKKVTSNRSNLEKNRKNDLNKKAYESAYNSFLDRPLAPPAPPRPETPRLFSKSQQNKKQSRSKLSEAEAQYISAAADWSPRHQDPSNENQIKSSSNRINTDKENRYPAYQGSSHSEVKHKTPQSTPSPNLISHKHEHRPIYDNYDKRDNHPTIRPDVNEGHRYYHQALEKSTSKIHYPVVNYHEDVKPRQPERRAKGVIHEKQQPPSRPKSNPVQRPKINENRNKNNNQGRSNNQRSVVNHDEYQAKHQTHLPIPPPPRVNYDVPEFPLPVMRFHQSSDSTESNEHKPTSSKDTSDSYSSEHRIREENKNQLKNSNHISNYSGEKNFQQREKDISSEFNNRNHGSGYSAPRNNQGSSENYHPHHTIVYPLPPPPPSPSAYSSQPSPSRRKHHSSPKLLTNNQPEPMNKKRPAAYPPALLHYDQPRNQQTNSEEDQQSISLLIPKVFYHENSASDESSVSSSHEHNQHQNRDFYSYEGEPQSNSQGPVYINKMLTSQEVDHRSTNRLNFNPDQSNHHRQPLLSPREDNSASSSNERSKEILTSSPSSAEAYSTFKTGLKGLVPLIRRNEDNPYNQIDHLSPLIMAASHRINIIAKAPLISSSTSPPLTPTSSSVAKLIPIYKD